MDVKEAIQKRRAYRALGPVEITDGIIAELATAAQMTASCFNNQPSRFVFARSPEALAKVREGLARGNEWAYHASLIIGFDFLSRWNKARPKPLWGEGPLWRAAGTFLTFQAVCFGLLLFSGRLG